MDFILASASPRRQQMLRDLDLQFRIRSPEIDETRLRGEPPRDYVLRLAREKAFSVAQSMNLVTSEASNNDNTWAVLAADTTVVFNGSVFGKPESTTDALKMLTKLSGRTHEVITGFCWLGQVSRQDLRFQCNHVVTRVTFSERQKDFWKWYVSTGEPMDKAGAYAAQGIGMSFIEKVNGSYSNIVGLPLAHVLGLFKKIFGGDLREHCRKSQKN